MTKRSLTNVVAPVTAPHGAAPAAKGLGRFKPYPAYKDSGVEWLGEIPAHWEVKPLKALLCRNDGGVWGEEFDDEGVIVLRSTEQTVDGNWKIDNPARRKLTIREASAGRLALNDLVVTKSSGSELHIGKTSIVDERVAGLGCCFSNFMQRLRIAPPNIPRLYWYFLNCPVAREQLVYLSSTTTGLGNLNGSILGAIRVPVAPEPEQRAIAAFLDRETAKIDALVAKKERLITLLQEKRTALISHAVTKGLDPSVPMKDSGVEWLGPIPAHWEVRCLRHVVKSVKNGTTVNQLEYGETEYRVTRIETISNGVIDLSKTGFVEYAPELDQYRLEKGDVLLSHINSISMLGNCALYDLDVALYGGMNLLCLRPNDAINGRWLWNWLRSVFGRESVRSRCKPAINQASIPIGALKSIPTCLPPLHEQRAIAAFLDRETAKIDALIAKVREAIERLKEYRTALISAAVTGKIDVRELGSENLQEVRP